ncbi:MAG: CapA family protein [Capnocytophaga sp.]|nr:CapA family protein [Capnocytophaga sp.]
MKKYFFLINLLFSVNLFPQFITSNETIKKDTINEVSFLFIGDIMGHSPQINSAYNTENKQYEYNDVFEKVAPIIQKYDFAIANLEVTLAGKPYTGYPTFSSPDALAFACKNAGIDAMVTANNHSCDRGLKGIMRTIKVLDSLEIKRTGTFTDSIDREVKNLLFLDKNNISVGILNYTYGTNGLPIPSPTIVNLLDTLQIKKDIEKAKKYPLDKLIAFVHWGDEYARLPNKAQKNMAQFLFKNGVDIIIGSHSHTLQPMEIIPNTDKLLVYSLGNYVSNQRKRYTDGGAMVKFVLKKDKKGQTWLTDAGYYLTWVHIYDKNGKKKYEILPCASIENKNFENIEEDSQKQLKIFIEDSRKLFKDNNVGDISEVKE